MLLSNQTQEIEVVSSPQEINFRYLSSIIDDLRNILYKFSYTELAEIDHCARIWHQCGIKGPFFFVQTSKLYYFIILNQNSKDDMIKEIKYIKSTQILIIKQYSENCIIEVWFKPQNRNYLQFTESKNLQNIYSLWFSSEEELNMLINIIQIKLPALKMILNK